MSKKPIKYPENAYTIGDDTWYYVEPLGIWIATVKTVQNLRVTQSARISWRRIEEALKIHRAVKRAKAKSKEGRR